ncbi:MAG TPA: ABC transporter substrate-binding protein [Steroidobacteraceae bacterium]|nr:ABC transporter substrate-binding protein [Steroidobacteraceae bacterium]
MRIALSAALAALVVLGSVPALCAADADDPSAIVQASAEGLLQGLDANREMYRKDPSKVRELVDKFLLPHFDIQFSARLVLGPHWRDASAQQRQAFVDAFESSLLTNYGSALAEFTANRLKVLPSRTEAGASSATVRTQIRRDDGSTVDVNYQLHRTAAGWQAWDVVIDGISYVKSFRDDFGAEIDKDGLDSVIQRLQHGAKPASIGAKPEAGRKS